MKVKICGLQSKADVDACRQADMLGFVTEYPVDVRWNVSAYKAKELTEYAGDAATCIVTGGDQKKILDLCGYIRPNFVQLHYRETLSQADSLARELYKSNIKVIKTLPHDEEERRLQFGTANIKACVDMINNSAIHSILLDSRSHANAGEVSIKADLELYATVKEYSARTVILAGGITPLNVGEVVSRVNPDFIDVMSGVENGTGGKDEDKVRRLIKAVRDR